MSYREAYERELQRYERERGITSEQIFCFTKGEMVPMEVCVSNCGAPELRPACWAARGIAHSFDGQGDTDEGEGVDAGGDSALGRVAPRDVP